MSANWLDVQTGFYQTYTWCAHVNNLFGQTTLYITKYRAKYNASKLIIEICTNVQNRQYVFLETLSSLYLDLQRIPLMCTKFLCVNPHPDLFLYGGKIISTLPYNVTYNITIKFMCLIEHI